MAIQSSSTMVGRDAELTQLAASLGIRPARPADRLSDVLLAGDAGVGKTRLLRALRDLAFAQGWQVFAGHCLDFGDSALPYLPFSEVVGRMATALPDLVADVAATHPALTRLQPLRRQMGREGVDRDTATVDRGDLFRSMLAVLEAAAQRAPVLVVIEDTHWADQSTRDMLSYLLSRSDAAGFCVVASYRADDLHRRHPLRRQVAEWSRLGGVERVQLAPLTDDAVRELVAQLVPGGLPEPDLAGVVARAEGNAFFVEELTQAAAEHDAWVPADLADVLLVRLDRLDATARQVVRTASASGRRVGHEMLAATSGLTPADLEEGLRAAVEMNVLVADKGSYAFRHALLGEAVYDDLLPGERVRLHTAYVRALQDGAAPGTAAELARHARLAMDRDTALTASVKAGNEAMAVGGPDEAAYHYQQALELLADGTIGVDELGIDPSKVVASAAEALTLSGDPERAIAVVQEQLDRLPAASGGPGGTTDAQRSRMLSAQAAALYITEGGEAAIDLSREALELAPPGDSGLRARVMTTHARILAAFGHFEQAQVVGMDALELAEKLDLNVTASDAITTLGGLKRAGPKEGLRAALEEAVERAVANHAVHAELRGRFLLGRSYEDWADFDQAERWFRSAADRAEAAGVPWAPYGFESRWQLVWIRFARGEWDDALALMDAGSTPPPIPRAMLTERRLTILQARGDDVSNRAAGLRPFWRREGAVAVHAAQLEIVAAGRRGDAAAAVAAYDDVVDVLSRLWHEWFSGRTRLAAVTLEVLADLMPSMSAADRATWAERAERLHTDGHTVVEHYADPSGHWGPEGRAWLRRVDAETLRVRWLAGDGGVVEPPSAAALVQTWQETVDLFEAFGHVYELAVVRTRLASILRAQGDLAGARELADLARATAQRLGARPLLDALRSLGTAPVARATEPAASVLTVREREILALVAEGRTNGEIAKQLFISTKTVSVHVSNILGKLDAASRTEAAAIARRRGLLG